LTKGPVELLGMRLQELEARAGITMAKPPRQREREGKPTAADRWIMARLGTDHVEKLDRFEEDLLGDSLLCEQRGEMVEAQRFMDLLAEHHKIRLESQATTDENGGEDEASG
jgi:hypothetical protein